MEVFMNGFIYHTFIFRTSDYLQMYSREAQTTLWLVLISSVQQIESYIIVILIPIACLQPVTVCRCGRQRRDTAVVGLGQSCGTQSWLPTMLIDVTVPRGYPAYCIEGQTSAADRRPNTWGAGVGRGIWEVGHGTYDVGHGM